METTEATENTEDTGYDRKTTPYLTKGGLTA